MPSGRRKKQDWSPGYGGVRGIRAIWPPFVDGYLEAALSVTQDDTGRPLSRDYTIEAFSHEAVRQAVSDSNRFIEENRRALERYGRRPEWNGHEFFMSRNSYSEGFEDRALKTAARAYPPVEAYWEEDGRLHFGRMM